MNDGIDTLMLNARAATIIKTIDYEQAVIEEIETKQIEEK